jgi:thymidylate kinase
MLIAFEGQDGAGKTALLEAVHIELEQRGIESVVVEEFSDSPYGQRLIDAVARDKFLRPVADEPATHLTRALEEVTDLYYLDERVIGPAVRRGCVVLKDRHYATVLYTLVPTLVEARAVPDEDTALAWLRALLTQLRHSPDVTVYVDAPLDIRLRRIEQCTRHLVEARANQLSAADVRVFAQRDAVARRIIREEHSRFFVIDNGNRPLMEGVQEIVEMVCTRRASTTAGEGDE